MFTDRYLIQVVDINEESLEMLAGVYESEGYEVSGVSTYEQLLFNLEDEVPDLLTINFSTELEVMKDLFLRIREEERFYQVPILGLFEGETLEEIDEFIDLGITGYCLAPTTGKQLLLNSANLMDLTRTTKKLEQEEMAFSAMNVELKIVKKELNSRLADIKILRDKLSRVNVLDSMTGLFNRAYAIEQLEVAISRFNRKAIQSAVIMCDIDNFKVINGEYGHNVGDHIIREIASVISTRKRQQDIIARYAGETYIIILPDTELEGAKFFANRALKTLEEHKFGENNQIQLTMTVGVTIYDKIMPLDMVVQMTEDAVVFGKESGKNRVVVSNELMRLM